MSDNVVEILVKSKDQTKSGFDSANKGASSFGDRMRNVNKVAVGASIGIAAGLLVVGKSSVETSRRMTELDAKSSAVFEGSLGSVQAWAEKNKKAFGSSAREVTGLAANFADLLKPMGFTAQQAAKMATKTLDLSGALAQWSGGQYKAAEVSEILSKAMLGERDQLKSLGISISEADVQQRLAANGADKLTGAALAQAKALATQELIMEKSTDAQKAWANGGRDAATAQGAAASAMATTQETVARLLTPAIVKGTEALAKFAGWAEKNQTTVMVLGGVLAGLAATVLIVNAAVKVYAAGTVIVSAATKAWAATQWLLNAALTANPIGVIVVAVAALVAAFVLAWKKSDTFKSAIVTLGIVGIKSFRFLLTAALSTFGGILTVAEKTMGWLPGGIGDAIKSAKESFDGFKDKTVANLKKTEDALQRVKDKANGIKSPNPIYVKVNDNVSQVTNKLAGLDRKIKGIHGRTMTIYVNYLTTGKSPQTSTDLYGVPRKRAHGGIGGGLLLVGERGRELIKAPQGSTVIPNGTTEAMLAGGGSGGSNQPLIVQLLLDGKVIQQSLLKLKRTTSGGQLGLA